MWNKMWAIRRSWMGYFGFVALLHAVGFAGLFLAWRSEPAMLSMGLLAYSLGLRHAFDADHIAAIDNTVRKLLEQKRSPMGVGFYFSLGHSSVVFLLVVAIAFSVNWIQANMPLFEQVGGVVGASVSGLFLVFIGAMNLFVLIGMLRTMRKLRRGDIQAEDLSGRHVHGGWLSRLTKPLLRFVGRSWHVYPLGFLFGLGFDTATEIGLLAMSAGAAQHSVSALGILSLPILFAAGMSLMDTADGMFMTNAYKWAFSDPIRKLRYNATVTAVSVVAALLIGAVELIQVLAEQFGLRAAFFRWIGGLGFGSLGYGLVLLFLLAWIVSMLVWKGMKPGKRFTA